MDRWLDVVAVTGIAALLLMGLAAPRPHTVEAQKLLLKDKAGKVRAALGENADGEWGLTLYAADGKPRASLQLDDNGEPQLDLRAAASPVRATLDAATGLGLIGPEGTRRATFGMDAGEPAMALADKQGRARLALRADDAASVSLYDEQTTRRIFLGFGGGDARVYVLGGIPRRSPGTTVDMSRVGVQSSALMEARADGTLSLRLHDPARHVPWKAP
jgi:hypothetical protein